MPRVSIKDENKEFVVPEGEVIFDSLDNQGYELPHGCLAGSCGACRIEVISGNDALKEPSVIEKNTIEAIKQNHQRIYGPDSLKGKVVRLACRARVTNADETIEIKPLK